MDRPDPTDAQGSWFAPTPLARQRVVERGGTLGRAAWAAASIVAATLIATAIFRDAWALLPLGVLIVGAVVGPMILRRGAHPEYVEFAVGICITVAMAAAAGVTGGTSSPVVFLLPVGVVMNALRAGTASIAICSVVTAVTFVVASLLADPAAVRAEPLLMVAVLAMLGSVTVGSIALARAELGHRTASIVDPLTGLLNRQALEDRFEELRQQALVSRSPITLVLFDLDHFKRVNDQHGHDVGDRLLCEVAYEVRTSLRRFELAYRVGGEEFLVLLPGVPEPEGEVAAENLRAAVERARLPEGVGVTASFGVSSGSGEEIAFDRLYRRADRALYRAKRDGRDRVRTSAASLAA